MSFLQFAGARFVRTVQSGAPEPAREAGESRGYVRGKFLVGLGPGPVGERFDHHRLRATEK
jgi:hypothetical protein